LLHEKFYPPPPPPAKSRNVSNQKSKFNWIVTFLLIPLVALAISNQFAGCKKTGPEFKLNSLTHYAKTFDDYDSVYAHADKYLTYLAIGFAGMTDSDTFKTILYNEIAKEFDGDYNVIIDSLIIACTNHGFDLQQKFNDVLSDNSIDFVLEELLDAFRNLTLPDETEACSFYPQIYVPNFDLFEDKSASDIGVIPYNGDEERTDFTIYKKTGSGPTIVQDVGTFDSTEDAEDDLEEDIHWVVSINESVNCFGEAFGLELAHYNDGIGGETGQGSCECSTQHDYVDWYLEEMIVHKHRESALGGKSEVFMKAGITYFDSDYPSNSTGYIQWIHGTAERSYSTKGKPLGEDLTAQKPCKISRKTIKNATLIDYTDFSPNGVRILRDWPVKCYFEDKAIVVVVIYERDWFRKPGFNHIHVKNPEHINWDGHYVGFSSNNPAYIWFMMKGNPCSQGLPAYGDQSIKATINNDDIIELKFNIVY
jgi:hypothetical protein